MGRALMLIEEPIHQAAAHLPGNQFFTLSSQMNAIRLKSGFLALTQHILKTDKIGREVELMGQRRIGGCETVPNGGKTRGPFEKGFFLMADVGRDLTRFNPKHGLPYQQEVGPVRLGQLLNVVVSLDVGLCHRLQ